MKLSVQKHANSIAEYFMILKRLKQDLIEKQYLLCNNLMDKNMLKTIREEDIRRKISFIWKMKGNVLLLFRHFRLLPLRQVS